MINTVKRFFVEEDGLGTVEIVVIIAVLIGLALIFRKQVYALVDQIFNRIFKDAGDSTADEPITTKSIN